MKSLVQFIKESEKTAFDGPEFFSKHHWDLGYIYYNAETGAPSIEEIKDAFGTTSNVTGDPSFGNVDGCSFTKLKNNEWKTTNTGKGIIGGTELRDEQILKMIEDSKDKWFLMLRFKK